MTKPTNTLTRLAYIAATGRRPRLPRRARPDPAVAAKEAEAFVSRIDGTPEPQAVPPTQWARHATHGIGEVLSTIGEGQDRKYSIDFADEVHTVPAEAVELLFAPKPAARHEPGGLGLTIMQAATQRARRARTPALGGQWVRHPTWGLGEVLATIDEGCKYRVDFGGEVVTLRARYVKVVYTTPAT